MTCPAKSMALMFFPEAKVKVGPKSEPSVAIEAGRADGPGTLVDYMSSYTGEAEWEAV